jgi:hypothetical protein
LPFGVIGSVWFQTIHFDAIFPLIPLVPQENRINIVSVLYHIRRSLARGWAHFPKCS